MCYYRNALRSGLATRYRAALPPHPPAGKAATAPADFYANSASFPPPRAPMQNPLDLLRYHPTETYARPRIGYTLTKSLQLYAGSVSLFFRRRAQWRPTEADYTSHQTWKTTPVPDAVQCLIWHNPDPEDQKSRNGESRAVEHFIRSRW
jgi:hypothetical protein